MTERVPYVTLAWRGGVHRFRLEPGDPLDPTGTVPMLEPVRATFQRLVGTDWSSGDVSETILRGLIGGGHVAPTKDPLKTMMGGSGAYPEAVELVRSHVIGRPLAESLAVAQAVMMARIYGLPPALADTPMEAADVVGATLAALTEADA